MSESRTTPDVSVAIAKAYNLGPHWQALVFEDGTIALQHRSTVVNAKTGEVLDLNDSHSVDSISELEDPRLIVTRAIGLSKDGSVYADVHGISPGGMLSSDAYKVMDSTIDSIRRHGIDYLENLITSLRQD